VAEEVSATFHVAIVVFCEATGVDERDAAYHAQRSIIRSLLHGKAPTKPVMLDPLALNGHEPLPPVAVHDAQEIGMAARNGYLWTGPTGKSYPRMNED